MPDEPSDHTLLARARDGEEGAFVILYERHRDPVFRFACRMLGSVEAAEDVAHDCFLGLMTQPLRFDPARARCAHLPLVRPPATCRSSGSGPRAREGG